ncbi:MAG: hypothetical protein A2189_02650 [Paenibacillus sp. RIFOXYA1_FULL_44_5]|nr:MAG: hypothetical protein A2189_02650 [Paenibacillus sp. RIFOXYA1_FULL_44_5]
MNHSFISAAGTMFALQQKLDNISNNLANMDTVGFKRSEVNFQNLLTDLTAQPDGFKLQGRMTPLGFQEGWGAKTGSVQLHMEQGPIKETGQSLDMAIQGDALFEVSVPAGINSSQTAWTRSGDFSLSINPNNPATMNLTTKDGYLLKGANGQPIQIPAGSDIKVDASGNITAYRAGQSTQVGQLKLMHVIRPDMLTKLGDNLYGTASTVANQNNILQAMTQPSNWGVSIQQGALEQSNVNVSDEMLQLIEVQRAYELNAKALNSADVMMNLANTMRA